MLRDAPEREDWYRVRFILTQFCQTATGLASGKFQGLHTTCELHSAPGSHFKRPSGFDTRAVFDDAFGITHGEWFLDVWSARLLRAVKISTSAC